MRCCSSVGVLLEKSISSRRALLAVVLALSGAKAGALPVKVALDWHTAASASAPARAHIEAVCTSGAADKGIPIEIDTGPDGAVLDLSEGIWQVQASESGYWSQAAEVKVTGQPLATVRLALWPAAILQGEIRMSNGEMPPDFLDIRLNAVPPSADEATASQATRPRPDEGPSRAELRCRIDEKVWNCLGPAGIFDVEIEGAGYAPSYDWGVSLKAGQSTDFGWTELRRTASVFGRALRKDGSIPPGPCRAILRRDGERRGAPEPGLESAPPDETTFSVPLTRRGYFQVVGASSGRNELSVECPGASGLREVSVQAESETRIDPPVQLEELTLAIVATPKTDPDGQPWLFTVDATAPRMRRIANRAMASTEGSWDRRGMMAGSYRVTVNSSDGTPFLQRDFDLGERSRPLSLHLGSVRVAGRVTLSSRPVRARLLFFNDEAGGAPVTFDSDDQGNFQGLLPVAPDVAETSWVVEAHVAQPSSIRRMDDVSVQSVSGGKSAWLELALPTIAVRGTVVSEEGEPQSSVQVTFENSRGVRTETTTDDTGSFRLPELLPGNYTAMAESFEGISDRTALEVTDGSESELRLILRPSKRTSIYVVSSQGPVSDATVQVWIPPGVPRFFAHTDADGRFEVKLPNDVNEVGLTVGASGYATKLVRLPITTEGDASSNANTVTLDVSAGALELDLKFPGRALDNPATPYLVHNGAIQEAATLPGWGTSQSGSSGDDLAEIEAIEPGAYALCFIADAANLARLWQGEAPPDICRKGTLGQGKTLTLSLR